MSVKNNIVFDLLLLEADRVLAKKVKGLDLYYKDDRGDYVPIAEAYDASVNEMIDTLFKRKKTQSYIASSFF